MPESRNILGEFRLNIYFCLITSAASICSLTRFLFLFWLRQIAHREVIIFFIIETGVDKLSERMIREERIRRFRNRRRSNMDTEAIRALIIDSELRSGCFCVFGLKRTECAGSFLKNSRKARIVCQKGKICHL